MKEFEVLSIKKAKEINEAFDEKYDCSTALDISDLCDEIVDELSAIITLNVATSYKQNSAYTAMIYHARELLQEVSNLLCDCDYIEDLYEALIDEIHEASNLS